jgi:hypothetical protein
MPMMTLSSRLRPTVYCFIALLLLATTLPAQATVSARLSSQSVVQGQPVRLILEMQGEQSDSPDLGVLEKDFEILERATQQSISIINGKMSAERSLVLTLLPKTTGTLTIPPIPVGSQQTAPLTLEVTEQAAGQDTGSQLARVELSLNKDQAYPQEEVLLTLSLIRQVGVRAEHLDDPVASQGDTRIELLDEHQYTREENGEIYRVLERTYALFAYQTGQLEIAPIGFRGRSGGRSVFNLMDDPFSQAPTAQRFVQVASEPVSLEISPIPADFSGTQWLPAKQLLIEETGIDSTRPIIAGKPVTRRIMLIADGLMASQLPAITQEVPAGIKPYEERPQLKDTPRSSGISSSRQSVITLIPTKAGQYTLPAIEIPWWNIESEREEIARLPAIELQVTPAAATAGDNGVSQQATTTLSGSSGDIEVQADTAEVAPSLLQEDNGSNWLIWSLAAAWLATLAGWLVSHRSRSKTTPPLADKPKDSPINQDESDLEEAIGQIRQAYEAGDAPAARAHWLHWGQLKWPENPPNNLTRLASRCEDGLSAAILALEKAIYSPAGEREWKNYSLEELDPDKGNLNKPEPERENLLPLNP